MHARLRTAVPLVLLGLLALDVVPASAQSRVERRLALAPGGQFFLETDVGAIAITGDSASGASIVITATRNDFEQEFDIQVQESAGVARLSVTRRTRSWFRSWYDGRVQIEVHVPKSTSAELKTAGGSIRASMLAGTTRIRTSGGSLDAMNIDGPLDATTSGGSIDVRQVSGNTTLQTSGGSITAERIGGSLRAHTSGGGIRIDRVAGSLDADTSGGSISVAAAGNRVEAHTSGGSVTVGFDAGNNRGGRVSSSGGGVRVTIDSKVALTLDATSSGGGVTSDLPITVRGEISRRAIRGDLNGGGPLLEVRSSGGGVRIAAP